MAKLFKSHNIILVQDKKKNCRPQQYSTWVRQSRGQACWPLDLYHSPTLSNVDKKCDGGGGNACWAKNSSKRLCVFKWEGEVLVGKRDKKRSFLKNVLPCQVWRKLKMMTGREAWHWTWCLLLLLVSSFYAKNIFLNWYRSLMTLRRGCD